MVIIDDGCHLPYAIFERVSPVTLEPPPEEEESETLNGSPTLSFSPTFGQ
jgi:hypothetical protein